MAKARRIMKTEAKKGYKFGFLLFEAELRRLHEVMVQQIRKTPIGEEFRTKFQLKYRNGSVAFPASLDEVLEQENFGSSGILRLKMEVSDKDENASYMIGVQFSKVDEDGINYFSSIGNYDPIGYVVSGDDRDWVFVTSSQLDERIGKIKAFPASRFSSGARRSTFITLPLMIIPLVFLFMVLFADYRQGHLASEQLNLLENNWKSGIIKDSGELIIQTAKINLGSTKPPFNDIMLSITEIIGVYFILLLSGLCYLYFHPSYNFLWGDYLSDYEKRRSRGNLLFVGIILALVLCVLGNFISKRIGI